MPLTIVENSCGCIVITANPYFSNPSRVLTNVNSCDSPRKTFCTGSNVPVVLISGN